MAAQSRKYRTSPYINQNTARDIDVRLALTEVQPKKQLSDRTRKNREKASHMNIGYVLFLSAALLFAGLVLIGYIQMQTQITTSLQTIASLESQLNTLRMDNDEAYSRITSDIDLEEVKRVAINELGMKYAEEGQIITYSSDGYDYVRQLEEITE